MLAIDMSIPLDSIAQRFIPEAKAQLRWLECELNQSSFSSENGQSERLAIARAKQELEDIIRAAVPRHQRENDARESVPASRPYPPSSRLEGFSRLAHNLNNDLAIIMAESDILESFLNGQAPALARVRHIKATASRMAQRISARQCS